MIGFGLVPSRVCPRWSCGQGVMRVERRVSGEGVS